MSPITFSFCKGILQKQKRFNVKLKKLVEQTKQDRRLRLLPRLQG
jgi:hypothetical protein